MIRKIALSSPLFAAAAVESRGDTKKDDKGYLHTYEGSAKKDPNVKPLIYKPSELPLYKPINAAECNCHHKTQEKKPAAPVAAIEEGFRTVRESIQTVTGSISEQKGQLSGYIEHAKDQTKFIRDYLNEEDNTVPRAGAIAVGGLAGLIFGLRGGFFKRLIYSSVGAGGVASICYPKEAKVYSEQALVEGKKYATIGYNFIYGVKPGDANQKQLPHIPSNLDEVKTLVSDLGKSAYDAVFGDKKNKDDYLSFMNEVGVRMQTPSVNVNNQLSTTISATVGGGQTTTLVKRNNNIESQLSNSQISLIPSQLQPPLPQAQTHLQQLQQQQQQQQQQIPQLQTNGNGGNGNNKSPQAARAVLVCRPNSHPFQNRTLYLEPNVEVKIGRSVARNKVSETNAIFDCKVLSRNHAVLWYSDGKFFLRDTGSSNGTFINNQRLSQTTTESEPFEVSSGDIVQFGVDVMENARKETHGCIVATLKLFLPDGRETKASQSTLVGAICTKIEPSDLYRLNQYVQEIVQRDQIMESKLMNIQKTMDVTRKNSSACWQALIDEDRLLSRIDMLEKKLQFMQKNVSEDKLREEVLKLHEEKQLYQNSAKEALRKAYQERSDAIQRLTTIQRALCSSEDECSLLREQISKLTQQIQELTEKLQTIQNQFDEKMTEAAQNETDKNVVIDGLKDDLKMLQERMELLQNNYMSDEEEEQQKDKNMSSASIEKLSSLLMNSNIKNMKDSFDIISAICNENELESNEDSSNELDNATAKIYKKILHMESIINLIEESEMKKSASNNDSNVVSEKNEQQNQTVCDGNQNLNSSVVLAAVTDAKLLKKAIKNLKNCFIDFMKESTKLNKGNIKDPEASDEIQDQITTLKQELDSRPSLQDYKEKVNLIDELNEKLTLSETENLAFKLELTTNKSKVEQLSKELSEIKETEKPSDAPSSSGKSLSEATAQTEAIEIKEISTNTSFNENVAAEPRSITVNVPSSSSSSNNNTNKTEMSSGVEDISLSIKTSSDLPDASLIDNELKIIHHPDVQREEEMVIFKEKYTKLVEEKLKLDQELIKLREDYHQYRNKSIIQLLFILAPIFALFSYIFSYFISGN
uniref:MICOS complex subunit n=1 Tax=Culicoides sonorensis TaxID=179676 RepID=A0A336LQL4_CULSO